MDHDARSEAAAVLCSPSVYHRDGALPELTVALILGSKVERDLDFRLRLNNEVV